MSDGLADAAIEQRQATVAVRHRVRDAIADRAELGPLDTARPANTAHWRKRRDEAAEDIAMKALSDAQQRALLKMPVNGPEGRGGYGWYRQVGEIAELAGRHVRSETIKILIRRGFVIAHPKQPEMVCLTPTGRAVWFEIWRSRK